MNVRLETLVELLLLALLVGCGAVVSPTTSPPGGEVARSDKARLTGLAAPAADLSALAGGNSRFALDLYQRLRQESKGNFMYSPHSVSAALAMTYAGARGETAQQMAATLRFNLLPERLHPAFNTLDQELASRGKGAKGKDEQGFRLNMVNAIWGQAGYRFLPEFLDTLALHYGAGLRLLDFARAAEPARQTINNWVSERTEKRIPELIPSGAINVSTVLVLTNAVYFNAAWAQPFNKDATADGAFNRLDGGAVTVPLMRQRESFRYAEGDGWQALELPYDGHELAMVILLPAQGRFEQFEGGLNAERVETMLKALSSEQVDVTLPRFKFDSSFSLVQPLKAMGMRDAFGGGADFSGMDGGRSLFISEILHKAFVAVDEQGTEAAAATAVIIARASPPMQVKQFKADRPFVFLIRDQKTGATLFVGRVVNPGA